MNYLKESDKKMAEGIIHTTRDVMSEFPEIELGYVFGSFLKGNFRDIDIAILLSKKLEPYESMKFAMKVGRFLEKSLDYKYEFDIKILNSSPGHFRYQVIKTGLSIFFRNNINRIRYEADVTSDYLDYKETLDWFDQRTITA